jgi:uncharacterized membrane protein (TIGR02234 family)
MTGGRLKLLTIVALVIGAGLGLAGATQTWYTVTLSAAAGDAAPVPVSGSDASPALTALSLAGLALVVALAIAGRIARVVVGIIGVILGATVIFASAGNPLYSIGVRDAVSKATGITGTAAVRDLIGSVHASAWPTLALIGGIVIVLGSLAALITGGRWPGGSRRYDAVRFEEADGQESVAPAKPTERPGDSAVDDWDDLTRGEDPTDD